MPYASVSEVPNYVPADKRKQWLDVWNSAYERAKGTDKEREKSAFAQANGVAGLNSEKAIVSDFQKFFLLEKYDPFQGIATGIATAETVDRDNEILDYVKSKPFFEAWSESVLKDSGGKSFGNLRLQHDDKKVAGKLNAIEFNDEAKMIRVEAKVIDPVAKELLHEGALTGFSIGGRYVNKVKQADGNTRYVADPCEISVVDRPALPEAVFQEVKADGSFELRKFQKYEEPKDIADQEHKLVEQHLDEASPKLKEHVMDEKKCPTCGKPTDKCECADKAVRYLVPDGKHLPVTDESGKPSHSHMGAAWAALHGGYRGNKYEGPDKEKAIAALTALYHSEGMELPSAEKSIALQIDLADTVDMIKNLDIEDTSEREKVVGLLKSLEEELRKKMENDKDLTLDKAARHSIHQKIMAAKAHMDAHLEHCQKAHKAMHAHLDGIHRVLGGGPESMDEGGHPEEVQHEDPDKVKQVPGGSDTADKGFKFVEQLDEKGNKTGLFKRVPVNPAPLTVEDIQKAVMETLLAAKKAEADAIGDRSKVTPFRKAEVADKGTDGKSADGQAESMTKEDWEKYAAGDAEAIKKAQRCTAQKWQPTPSRLSDPNRYRKAQ